MAYVPPPSARGPLGAPVSLAAAPKKKGGGFWLAALIVAACAAGGYYYYQQGQEGKAAATAAAPAKAAAKTPAKAAEKAAAAPAAEAKPAAPAPAAGGKALAGLNAGKFITDTRPAAGAKYYIYLFSASWCGPCRAVMPKIVEQYPAMKASGVADIVLIGNDYSPEAGRAYMEHYETDFPCIMMPDAKNLPGIVYPKGIPYCEFIDAEGKLIAQGGGAKVVNWKSVIEEYETAQGLPSSFAAAPEAEGAKPAATDKKKGKKKKAKK